MLRVILGLLVLSLSPSVTSFADRPAAHLLRVLFVGNSYTYFNNLPQALSAMAASAQPPLTLETGQSAFARYTLEGHSQDDRTLKAIRTGGWDVVVLQEQSTRPVLDPAQMHAFARKLDTEIRQTGARTLFFMTWARRDKPEMIEGLAQAYEAIGAELGAVVAPVGLAWHRSLQERPRLALHEPDQSHPLPHGTYLTACVLYATLTGQNPQGLSNGGLEQLTPDEAHFLQRIAWETVRGYHTSAKTQGTELAK